jgi:SAM-dependent methyltransferase
MKKFLRKMTGTPLWEGVTSTLLGRRRQLVPPRELIFIGNGDFLRIGREFLGHFRKLGGLQPGHRVLDVGCGIGRMAIPLTKFLSEAGSYEGLDIVPHGIKWCTENLTPRFPRFRFQLADIRNKEYNPDGLVTAAEFRFPFEDGSFDFIFLTSVFTHMLPREVENYLSEIRRVLKPGGTCLITWFLLNPESEGLVKEGRSTLDFVHPVEGCLTVDPDVPEKAIAYQEAYVMDRYATLGLDMAQPVQRGSWCGRARYVSYQDMCIARRRDS